MWFSKIVIPIIAEICKDPSGKSVSTSNTKKENKVEKDSLLALVHGLVDVFFSSRSDSQENINQSILKTDNGKSYVFSTVAMQNILGIIICGAEDETKKEIQELTGSSHDDKSRRLNRINSDRPWPVYETKTLCLNNVLSGDKCFAQIRNFLCLDLNTIFEESFAEHCTKFYSAVNISVDTSEVEKSLKRVNRIVSEKTNGIFKDALKKLPIDRPLLILNTMTWNGTWVNKFNASNNCYDYFSSDEKKFKTTFMNLRAPFLIYTNEDYRLLKMSFVGRSGKADCLILLPNEGATVTGSNSDFKEKDVYDHFDKKIYSDVKLKIPKFRIETEVNLKNACKDIGLNSLAGENPNFDSMYEINTPPGANMTHKAIIDFHELGVGITESIHEELMDKNEIIQSTEFICDRPFYFFIVNDARDLYTTQSVVRKVFHGRYSGSNE